MSDTKKKASGAKIIARIAIWLSVGILLAAVAIPKFIAARQLSLRNACVNQLG
jgi:hypothetical protein